LNIELTIEAFSLTQFFHIYILVGLYLFQSFWQSTNTYLAQTSDFNITFTGKLINTIQYNYSVRFFIFLHYLVQMVKRKEGTDDEGDHVFLLV